MQYPRLNIEVLEERVVLDASFSGQDDDGDNLADVIAECAAIAVPDEQTGQPEPAPDDSGAQPDTSPNDAEDASDAVLDNPGPVDQAAPAVHVVIVNGDIQSAGIMAGFVADGTHVIAYSGNTDSFTDIVAALEAYTLENDIAAIDSITFLSHANAGTLIVGNNDTISLVNVGDYATDFERIGGLLTENGELRLAGCDLAADADGRALVDAIAVLTGADVYASDNTTGTGEGRDFVLEYRSHSESMFIDPEAAGMLTGGLLLSSLFDTNGLEAYGTDISLALQILRVDDDAAGGGDGLSWATAYNSLQDALTQAAVLSGGGDDVQIWLAEGTYLPSSAGDRAEYFLLPANTAVYGGFGGTESALNQRDWQSNVTILSGDLNGDDNVAFAVNDFVNRQNTDNSRVIVATGNNTVLDGVTVYGGMRETDFGFGAGISISNDTGVVIANCIVTDNWAYDAAGIYITNTSTDITITSCVIDGNIAARSGAGMYIAGSGNVLIDGTVFVGNIASGTNYVGGAVGNNNGGGLLNYSSNLVISDSIFYNNQARAGGGIRINTSAPVITNCTFYANNATTTGGGAIEAWAGAGTYVINVTNSIFWGNTAAFGVNTATSGAGDISFNITYSTREGQGMGTGNTSVNPNFVNAANPIGADGIWGTADDGLRVQSATAINTGNNAAVTNDNYDISGEQRILDGTVDMGAYETIPTSSALTRIYVDKDAIGGVGDGASWESAFSELRYALAVADAGDEIWVAGGTYTPGALRTHTFQMIDGVNLYGGFDGTDGAGGGALETALSERDWDVNRTILSGDLLGNDDPSLFNVDDGWDAANRGDNAYHVVVGADNSMLDGFVVTGGFANGGGENNHGGGFYFRGDNGAHATAANCEFTDNYAAGNGGGLYGCRLSIPAPLGIEMSIINSSFINNRANRGGAIGIWEVSNVIVENSLIVSNYATTSGGGMSMSKSTATITGSIFADNATPTAGAVYGGGLWTVNTCAVIISDSVFTGNKSNNGGGVYIGANDHCTITNSTFAGNFATLYGGGVNALTNTTLNFVNVQVVGNHVNTRGGGVDVGNGTVANFTNCTFAYNAATNAGSSGGGLRSAGAASNVTVENCIFWGNTALTAGTAQIQNAGTINVNNSDVQGGYAGANINVDPGFVGGPSSTWASAVYDQATGATTLTSNGGVSWKTDQFAGLTINPDTSQKREYYIVSNTANSVTIAGNVAALFTGDGNQTYLVRNYTPTAAAVVDNGNNAAILATGVATDVKGNQRVINSTVDMGAVENPLAGAGVVYVDADATGSGSGLSWENAFTELQTALAWIPRGSATDVWVAAGTYLPGTLRTHTFQMIDGVNLYGGFDGTDGAGGGALETLLSQRDFVTCQTILSGDIDGDGVLDADNSIHVVTGASAVLDGFVIRDGYASGAGVDVFGGGLFLQNANISIANCIFTNNYATQLGGGMMAYIGSTATITNTVFYANSAAAGGGLATLNSAISVANCVFSENSSAGGGAVLLYNVNISTDNSFTNCTFNNNTSTTAGLGGAFYLIEQMSNTTFTMNNCILYGNNGGEIIVMENNSYTLNLNDSIIAGGVAGINIAAGTPTINSSGILDVDPQFLNAANPAGSDGRWFTMDDGLTLKGGSAAIDAANTALAPATDMLGLARPINGGISNDADMGAYEYAFHGLTNLFVDIDATGNNTGLDWANAFNDLQTALGIANYSDLNVVWVAEGTYTPTTYRTAADRSVSFNLDGVTLYGGFNPDEGITAFADRDWENQRTILSGDIDHNDNVVYNGDYTYTYNNYANNTINVVRAYDGAMLDGFVVQGGSGTTEAGNGLKVVENNATVIIRNNLFQYNMNTNRYGGAISTDLITGAIVTIDNCDFIGNKAQYDGAVNLQNLSTLHISDSFFKHNYGTSLTGAVGSIGAAAVLTIDNSVFYQNKTGGNGGALDVRNADITNCVFVENVATNGGGAIYVYAAGVDIVNCTFVNNSRPNPALAGQTIMLRNGAYTTNISNSIMIGTATGAHLSYGATNVTNLINSRVQGFSGTGTLNLSGHIFTCDPEFVIDTAAAPTEADYAGTDGKWGTADDGLRLQATSYLIDEGNNAAIDATGIATDITGAARKQNTYVDLGAYESATSGAQVIYVDLDAGAGTDNGHGWVNAFVDLQEALAVAGRGDEIWVAGGTYTPGAAGDRTQTFRMIEGVNIYGGFDGTDGAGGGALETALTERDWNANPTILSGDLLGNDTGSYAGGDAANRADNAYHVVTGAHNAIFDGFVVVGGQADGGAGQNLGGGMYNVSIDADLRHITFTDNYATAGGAIANYTVGTNNLLMTDCVFDGNAASIGGAVLHIGTGLLVTETGSIYTDNSATTSGGAVSISQIDAASSFSNILFAGNRAGTDGGAVYVATADVLFTACIFDGNTAADNGGALTLVGGGNALTAVNCIFYGNAADAAGAIYNDAAALTVINSTFVNNGHNDFALMNGPAVVSAGAGAVSVITNSLFWNNYWMSPTNTMFVPVAITGGAATTLDYCVVQNGWSGAGANNTAADPLLLNVNDGRGVDNIWGTADDGLRFRAGSSAVDAGTNAGAPATDAFGVARPVNGTVDIGAYETPVQGVANRIYVDASAGGWNHGTSWSNAYTNLQDALAAANAGFEIWVAGGTYTPGAVNTDTFQLIEGVALYGGFSGSENNLTARNWVANQTVLSGEIGGAGAADNIRTIVTGANDIVLDGFIVTGAYSNNSGGGYYSLDCSNQMIRNCFIVDNYAANFGGGACMFNGTNTVFSNVVFSGNATPGNGGAIAAILGNVEITNCTFSGNSAANGGAVYTLATTPVISNSILWGNAGGEIAGTATVANSVVAGGFAGTNVFDADPLFANAANHVGADGIWGTADDGLRLKNASYAINAGDNALSGGAAKDIGHGPRIRNWTIDIGAYESSYIPPLPETPHPPPAETPEPEPGVSSSGGGAPFTNPVDDGNSFAEMLQTFFGSSGDGQGQGSGSDGRDFFAGLPAEQLFAPGEPVNLDFMPEFADAGEHGVVRLQDALAREAWYQGLLGDQALLEFFGYDPNIAGTGLLANDLLAVPGQNLRTDRPGIYDVWNPDTYFSNLGRLFSEIDPSEELNRESLRAFSNLDAMRQWDQNVSDFFASINRFESVFSGALDAIREKWEEWFVKKSA